MSTSNNEPASRTDETTATKVPHGNVHNSVQCFSCSNCSYGWYESVNDKPFSFCPNCGSKLVTHDV